jgi:hypothetical protein
VLLLAINAAILGLSLKNCRKFPETPPSAAPSGGVVPRRVIFPPFGKDGEAEAIRRRGTWYFVRPISWPAQAAALDDELWRRRSVGECTTLGGEVAWADFLDHHLLPEELHRPVRLRLRFGDDVLILENGGGVWKLLSGGILDDHELQRCLRHLRKFAFLSVVGEGAEALSVDPQLEFTLEGPFPDQRRRLEFFLERGCATVRVDGKFYFSCGENETRALLESSKQLRSRKFFPREPEQQISWREGKRLLVIRRGTGEPFPWAAAASDGEMVILGPKTAKRMLAALREMAWKELATNRPEGGDLLLRGLGEPATELNVDGQQLLLANPIGQNTYIFDRMQNAIVIADVAPWTGWKEIMEEIFQECAGTGEPSAP